MLRSTAVGPQFRSAQQSSDHSASALSVLACASGSRRTVCRSLRSSSSSQQQLHSRHKQHLKAADSSLCCSKQQRLPQALFQVSLDPYGSKSRRQLGVAARSVSDGSSPEPAAEQTSQPVGEQLATAAAQPPPQRIQWQQQQQQQQAPAEQTQQATQQQANPQQATPAGAASRQAAEQPNSQSSSFAQQPVQQQQQQGQTSLQLSAGQFRQQLRMLLQQQQQLQEVLDAAAGLQAVSNSNSGGGDRQTKKRSKLRTAAAGSTDLLLALLQSQLPVLTGQVPVSSITAGASAAAAEPAAAAAEANWVSPPVQQQQQQDVGRRKDLPQPTWQQQLGQRQQQRPMPQRLAGQRLPPPEQQQQQWGQQPVGRKQRCASGAPPHVPLLAEALNTIAWHCKRQQLLPGEASRLQALMLDHLLPALRPHMQLVNRRQLARVVYALGSCYASTWEEEEEEEEEDHHHHQQQQQQSVAQSVAQRSSSSSSSIRNVGAHSPAGTPAAAAAAAMAAASAAWVRRLLPLLPPSSLTAGALLATWQGCALHQVRPSDKWLHQASWVMVGHLQGGKLDFNDTSGLMQACAALDYRPPGWLMVPLVTALQQQLGLLTPADLAGVLSSLQDLSYRPSDTWLRVWCEVSSRHLRGMSIDQLAAAAGALAWTNYSAKPWWGRRLTAAALPLLPVATADELLLLLHSLLSMRLAVEPGWVHEAYCHLARQRRGLGLSQLADAAHVLGIMGLPPDLVKVHRSWLAGCLQHVGGWQGGAAAAALSRSELLYMLYAAARLRVSPGDTLLSAALQRLHRELPQATPAELAGCLSVFCYWWRQQQQLLERESEQQQISHSSSRGVDDGETVDMGGSSSSSYSSVQEAVSTVTVPVNVMGLLQLRDCLSAVVSCSSQFSDEGLLQLLMTCAKASLGAHAQPLQHLEQQLVQQVPEGQGVVPDGAQQQQQQQAQDAELLAVIHGSIVALVGALVGRLPGMSLVQLARVSRTLEGGVGSSGSSSGSSSSAAGAGRPGWFSQLLQQVKAALAARA